MKIFAIIIIAAIFCLLAYCFPHGVKIFGIPAETIFKKDSSDKNNSE